MLRWRHHVKWWRRIKNKVTYEGEHLGESHQRKFGNLLWFRSYAAKCRFGSMCVNEIENGHRTFTKRLPGLNTLSWPLLIDLNTLSYSERLSKLQRSNTEDWSLMSTTISLYWSALNRMFNLIMVPHQCCVLSVPFNAVKTFYSQT